MLNSLLVPFGVIYSDLVACATPVLNYLQLLAHGWQTTAKAAAPKAAEGQADFALHAVVHLLHSWDGRMAELASSFQHFLYIVIDLCN